MLFFNLPVAPIDANLATPKGAFTPAAAKSCWAAAAIRWLKGTDRRPQDAVK